MAGLDAKERDQVAALFAALKVEEGFARLAAHEDLKATDLPKLEKGDLAALGADLAATRALAAGLLSPSLSVRRMARKYAPKLPGHGPGALLLLAVECVRPFRRLSPGEEGLAGRFGAFATPLGASVLEAGLSFEVPNPTVAVYSPATRLLKEAMENLAGALGQAPERLFLRALEYTTALARPFARVEERPLPDDGVPARPHYQPRFALATLQEALQNQLHERVKKEDPALLAAIERWAAADPILDDEAPPGSAEAHLRSRWRELPEEERRRGAAILPATAGRLFRSLPQSKQVALFWRIKAGPTPPTPAFQWVIDFTLADISRQLPRETSGSAPSPLPAIAPEGAAALLAPAGVEQAPAGQAAPKPKPKGPRAKTSAAGPAPGPAAPAGPAPAGATPSARYTPPVSPHLGPPRDQALAGLVPLAESAGLPKLWKQLVKDTRMEWLSSDDAPAQGRPPAGVEETLASVRAALIESARPSKERLKLLEPIYGRFHEEPHGYVPEQALAAATWAGPLGELLAGHENARAALRAALYLLPPAVLARHRAAWAEKARGLDPELHLNMFGDEVLSVVAVRGAAGLWPVLEPLLAAHAAAWRAMGDGQWDYALAAMYLDPDPEARAAAVRVLAASRPPLAESHYRCHCSGVSYRFLFRQAWEARDVDFVAEALARLVVPLYFKGKRALIPTEETLRYQGGYAPSEGSAPPAAELALREVVALVARERPGKLAEAVAAAGQVAAAEKGARAVLEAATAEPGAQAAIERRLADVVGLLEAPGEAALKSGLELLAPLAPLLGERLDEVFQGVERAVSSSSPGVLQASAALLGALALAHPARRGDAVRLLEECLQSSNVPSAEEALRALVKVVAAAGVGAKKAGAKKAGAKKAGAKKAGAKKAGTGDGGDGDGAGLSAFARERVAHLAQAEPKRLGRLAQVLLEG